MRIALFANTDWYLFNFRRSLILSLLEQGNEVLVICPDGDYVHRIAELGCRVIAAPLHRKGINPFTELVTIRWLARTLRDSQVELLHAFTVKCSLYAALVCRRADLPCVCAIAGVGYVFAGQRLAARALRPLVVGLFRLAMKSRKTLVVFQNPDDLETFVRLEMLKRDQARLIYSSGVNVDVFRPPEAVSREVTGRPALVVLLPARMLRDKGVFEFVEAASSVQEHIPEADFLLAGAPDEGNPGAVAKAQLQQWQATGIVRWLGHVDDMPLLYRSVDIVVLPTYYGEGLPRSLTEAGASGVPMITTDMPGAREAVEDGVNGLLIPAMDSAALADAILHLAHNPDLRRKMGRAARKRVLERFDEQIVLRKTLEVYSELSPKIDGD